MLEGLPSRCLVVEIAQYAAGGFDDEFARLVVLVDLCTFGRKEFGFNGR